ncbi:MAG: hypothetical protein ACQEQT_07520 [Chloroflexota bacterium]
MNVSFLVTVGIILVATLIGSALRARHKDRCLEDVDGFPVLVEHRDGRVIWGVMTLAPTGFELRYQRNVDDDLMYAKTSYVFYQNEYANIQAIYRHVDALSPDDRERRDRAWERILHPGPLHYMVRMVKNFVNTAIDSLTEIFGLFLKSSQPLSSGMVLAPGQTHLQGLTKEVLGYVGTSYDPLLEGFVGVQAVAELSVGEHVYEYVGILQEYSARFLELLDVYFPQRLHVELEVERGDGDAPPVIVHKDGVTASFADGELMVRNETPYAALIREVNVGGREDRVMSIVARGGTLRYAVVDPLERVEVVVTVLHRLDMILPRDSTLIRHRAERYRPAILFDIMERMKLSLVGGEEKARPILEDAATREQVEMFLRNTDRLRPADERLRRVVFDKKGPTAGGEDVVVR